MRRVIPHSVTSCDTSCFQKLTVRLGPGVFASVKAKLALCLITSCTFVVIGVHGFHTEV